MLLKYRLSEISTQACRSLSSTLYYHFLHLFSVCFYQSSGCRLKHLSFSSHRWNNWGTNMGSPNQRVVQPMLRDPWPQPLSTGWCRLSRHLLFLSWRCYCRIWQCVYAGGVRAIVCLWRLEIHSRVPGECHCWSLPQLAIVRPGVVTGWESFPMWLILPVKTPLPAPNSGKREWGRGWS